MPFFGGGSSPFDSDVEKVTDPKKTAEDWGLIMDLCDKVTTRRDGPKDCLKSIVKRLQNQDPHVALHAITLLDACINNCGKPFKLEVASRDFEQTFKKLLTKSHPRVQEKLREVLKKWAEGEFKGDQQLNLIPTLYIGLKREGYDFSGGQQGSPARARNLPRDPNIVANQQEEDDIAKAIQMSLQETKATPQTKQAAKQPEQQPQHLYPTTSLYGNASIAVQNVSNCQNVAGKGAGSNSAGDGTKESKKARALYDFEAAEDNELTFQAGEIVIIIDDSDENWWKGSNHRGEGLFPANFVTTDLEAEPEQYKEEKRRRSVQFNDDVEVKTLQDDASGINAQVTLQHQLDIDEKKIAEVEMMLNNADPTCGENDPPELVTYEDQVNQMGPLIDNQLEVVDRRLAQLTRLSTELVDALNMYHQLMRDMPQLNAPLNMGMGHAYGMVPQMYGTLPQQPIPPQPGLPSQPGLPPQTVNPGYMAMAPQAGTGGIDLGNSQQFQ